MTTRVISHTHVTDDEPVREPPQQTLRNPRRHHRWRRVALIAGIVFAVLIALALVALAVVHQKLPGWIRTRVVSGVHSKCPSCTMDIDGVQVSWTTGVVRFDGVHYVSDPNGPLVIDAQADEVDVDLSVSSLLRDVKQVERLELWGARLRLRQDKSKQPPGPGAPLPAESPLLNAPAMRIDTVAIHDASLVFTDHVHGRDARVGFSDIDIATDAIATRPGLVPEETRVRGSARLADSGALTLTGSVRPLSPLMDGHYELGLRHLALASLDGFLVPAEGIHVAGDVSHAHSTIEIHGRSLHGSLRGTYRDLDMHFDQMPNRGFFSNLVANVGEDVVMAHKKGDGPGHEEPLALDGHRGEHQAYFDFFWIALRTGIMNYIKR